MEEARLAIPVVHGFVFWFVGISANPQRKLLFVVGVLVCALTSAFGIVCWASLVYASPTSGVGWYAMWRLAPFLLQSVVWTFSKIVSYKRAHQKSREFLDVFSNTVESDEIPVPQTTTGMGRLEFVGCTHRPRGIPNFEWSRIAATPPPHDKFLVILQLVNTFVLFSSFCVDVFFVGPAYSNEWWSFATGLGLALEFVSVFARAVINLFAKESWFGKNGRLVYRLLPFTMLTSTFVQVVLAFLLFAGTTREVFVIWMTVGPASSFVVHLVLDAPPKKHRRVLKRISHAAQLWWGVKSALETTWWSWFALFRWTWPLPAADLDPLVVDFSMVETFGSLVFAAALFGALWVGYVVRRAWYDKRDIKVFQHDGVVA